MKSTFRRWPALLVLVSTINSPFSTLLAQSTAFTYQGRLQDNGGPASGSYNLQFLLYTNATGGTAIAGPVTSSGLVVSNGLFTVTMDFGAGVWNGATNWLEIAVETNGMTQFTTLLPRQQVTPTPYAITAQNLSGAVAGAGLSGTYGNTVTLNNSANQFTGGFTGNGGGLTNVNAATLGGLSASNFWQLASGGPGIQTNGGTGFGNSFTNTTLTTYASSSNHSAVVITNDPVYSINSAQSTMLEFTGVTTANQPNITAAGPAGEFGQIFWNITHDGTLESPSQVELEFLSPNRIMFGPNQNGAADSGAIQVGFNGVQAFIYNNFSSNVNLPPFAAGSIPYLFRSAAVTNGHTFEFDPGFAADWPNGSSSLESHFTIFHDTGLFGNYTTMPDKNKEIPGVVLYAGTNGSTFYSGVELYGRSGTTTNTLTVDTNGITLMGNVTAQNTFSAGIMIVPTNAAPLTIVSNFSPSVNTIYKNLLNARVEVAGSISCQAGGSALGAAKSATALALVNYTNNGVGAAPLQVASTVFGAATNCVVCPFRFDLGPGGTFEIVTNVIGVASSVGFPQNVTFTIQ